MRLLIFWFGISLFAAACTNTAGNKANETSHEANEQNLQDPLIRATGNYSGTWMYDTTVLMINLSLNADGTYSMSKMGLTQEALDIEAAPNQQVAVRNKKEIKGNFTCDALGEKVTLHPPDSGEIIHLRFRENTLVKITANDEIDGYNNNLRVLERNTKPAEVMEGYFVYHHVKPFSRYPVQVFLRTAGNHFTIHKTYLDAAPESEKALAAYYAMKYNTGCEQNKCTLLNAIQMDNLSAMKMVLKWMSNVEDAANAAQNIADPKKRQRLTFLFFAKTPNGIKVDYSLLDAYDGNLRGTDTYVLEGENWKLVSNTKPQSVGDNN